MEIIIYLILSTIAVYVTAAILPGIHLDGVGSALIVAIILGFVNTFIRPLLFILTLPINILTLGLFTFVIIGLCVLLVSAIVPGFHVDGFLWAIAFAVVFAIISAFIGAIVSPGP